MRVIALDATQWRDILDCHNALKHALGSCEGHGSSVDAWIDSMLYGGMNSIEPPYVICVVGVSKCPPELQHDIALFEEAIREAREWKRQHYGVDTEVTFDIRP